jgi:hypothetical protein
MARRLRRFHSDCILAEIVYMISFPSGPNARRLTGTALFLFALASSSFLKVQAQDQQQIAAGGHSFYINCSLTVAGDGSATHPWNALITAQAHLFQPGDQIALSRGTACHGAFAPQGSGAEGRPIRLTSFGHGARPRIVAPSSERQALLLFNQEYWQVDSLDISGGNTYGIFVSGNKGPLHHIHLKNLYVHDVMGGAMKNKDNGLVIVGPGSASTYFDDVLVDGVDAAHTNQWAGILIGGGNFGWDAPLNHHVTVSGSTVHDVFGDGIILFRDQDSKIKTSTAWQTGMQPTETTGTPNAIWTWTCTDCTVEDNEAYLTDSPGVDGGAYDIDWDNTRNIVQRNFAHDTQGYCVAVFAAGYTTSESIVRDNLCVDNGLSPRLSRLQGAVYLHTWNDGPIRGLRLEGNTIEWNPPVPDAAAIVNDALITGSDAVFTHNHIVSTAPRLYTSNAQLMPSENTYSAAGEPLFSLGDQHDVSLQTLQVAGHEKGSRLLPMAAPVPPAASLRLEAGIDLKIDADGLLAPDVRAQLVVLRSLAGQYGPSKLIVTVHLRGEIASSAEADVLRDLQDVYPGVLHFDHNLSSSAPVGVTHLVSAVGNILEVWHGFQNAEVLGQAVRARLGRPPYAHMQRLNTAEEKEK